MTGTLQSYPAPGPRGKSSLCPMRTRRGDIMVWCGTYGAPWLSAVTPNGGSYDAP